MRRIFIKSMTTLSISVAISMSTPVTAHPFGHGPHRGTRHFGYGAHYGYGLGWHSHFRLRGSNWGPRFGLPLPPPPPPFYLGQWGWGPRYGYDRYGFGSGLIIGDRVDGAISTEVFTGERPPIYRPRQINVSNGPVYPPIPPELPPAPPWFHPLP